MAKRNYINEILDKKSRQYQSDRWSHATERLSSISAALAALEEVFRWGTSNEIKALAENYPWAQSELARYFPIAYAACMEGYFRSAYADLINCGGVFEENAAKFDQIKFGLDVAIASRKSSVSLGEFVAHLLPTNNLEDINHNLTILIGRDFLPLWKQWHRKNDPQIYFDFVDSSSIEAEMIQGIQFIYVRRNIVCHELNPALSYDDCHSFLSRGLFETVADFMWASECIVKELIAGGPTAKALDFSNE